MRGRAQDRERTGSSGSTGSVGSAGEDGDMPEEESTRSPVSDDDEPHSPTGDADAPRRVALAKLLLTCSLLAPRAEVQ